MTHTVAETNADVSLILNTYECVSSSGQDRIPPVTRIVCAHDILCHRSVCLCFRLTSRVEALNTHAYVQWSGESSSTVELRQIDLGLTSSLAEGV